MCLILVYWIIDTMYMCNIKNYYIIYVMRQWSSVNDHQSSYTPSPYIPYSYIHAIGLWSTVNGHWSSVTPSPYIPYKYKCHKVMVNSQWSSVTPSPLQYTHMYIPYTYIHTQTHSVYTTMQCITYIKCIILVYCLIYTMYMCNITCYDIIKDSGQQSMVISHQLSLALYTIHIYCHKPMVYSQGSLVFSQPLPLYTIHIYMS